ncbi:MAG: SOS response-associated peptidase [Chitinophagales bacterium]
MCYDIKATPTAQFHRAKQRMEAAMFEEIQGKFLSQSNLPLHHTSGFGHPKLLIYTNKSPNEPTVSIWGLIPHWVKDKSQSRKIWNSTLNARSETIFEKPSFRDAAKSKRCIVQVDGFYEHHHFKGKTYPFFVHHRTNEPLSLAGLWSEWVDRQTGEILNTFSIVTTKANPMMAKIHNNPKLPEPRMPLILQQEWEDKWLSPMGEELGKKRMQELVPYPEEELEAHTVGRLRGKNYVGNIEEVSERVEYGELGSYLS